MGKTNIKCLISFTMAFSIQNMAGLDSVLVTDNSGSTTDLLQLKYLNYIEMMNAELLLIETKIVCNNI